MKHLPAPIQMFLHFVFLVVYGAQAQGLLADDPLGHWLILVVGSLQTVLALHGLYTPPPSRGTGVTGPRADQQ